MANYIQHETKMANMIKTLRNTRGLTQAELAEAVGISESHLRKIELGIKRPGIDTYEKIMRYFQADIEIRVSPETVRGKCLKQVQDIILKHDEKHVVVMTKLFKNLSAEIEKL